MRFVNEKNAQINLSMWNNIVNTLVSPPISSSFLFFLIYLLPAAEPGHS
jgi:hypothetical protein